MNIARARAALAGIRGPLIFVAVYLVLRAIFDGLTDERGLITPGGEVSFGVMGFGILVIALRLAALFVAPAVIVYRLVARW